MPMMTLGGEEGLVSKGNLVTWRFLILALALSSQVGSPLVVPAAVRAAMN